MVEFVVVPDRTALINVDLQTCFVRESAVYAPDGLTVLQRLNRLGEICRRAGIMVIHTRLVLRPDGSNVGVFGATSPPARDGALDQDAISARLDEALAVNDGDIILEKPRFGAFTGTDLELILRSRGIDTVIVGGVATNVCCDTTAREAMQREFRVFFLSDGTATADMGGLPAVELQRATLATMRHLFAQVLTVDDMIERIQAAATESGTH